MIRRWTSIGVILLTLGIAIYLAADAEGPSAEPASGEAIKRVRVSKVEAARESRELSFSGTTRAARRARLAFNNGGRLVARPVEVGDQVRRGQALARLDELELRNAVASARATLAELSARRAQTERELERAEQLVAAKAATSEELERASASVDALRASEDAARARLTEAERRLSQTRLTAPFAGTVTEVFFEPGEYASSGVPVVMLSGDGEIELEVEVPESIVPHIEAGDAVKLFLPALGNEPIQGRIESVGRAAAGPGRLFPVVAAVPASERMMVGASAEMVLVLESDRALTLPVEAVVNPGGRRPSVFRVTDDGGGGSRVEKLPVEVGALLGARVIVSGELEVGDIVVTGGQRGLLHGEPVLVESRGTPR
ncbi:MAG: efflux RND transporter periplasmic adaptor subunit [bacterium]|nr:efflux RND transporter periplasmic adaptor subunit [bacterium]